MTLLRTTHWDTREFTAWLLRNADRPFAWGQFDCCLAPADAVQRFTGFDLASPLRGQYEDEAGANAAIARITGGKTVEDAIAWCMARAGLMEWAGAPLCAQRGDLVLAVEGSRQHAGVVHTNGRHVVTAGEFGLRRLPLSAIRRAWKV